MVPSNNDTSNGWRFARGNTVGGGCSRKRKRQEPIVESRTIIGQFSHDHLAEHEDERKCNEKVFTTVQQDVLGGSPQMTTNAHVQHAQPAPSAFMDTTTRFAEVNCNHINSGHVNAEQVCFGMVCIVNSCRFSPLVIAECWLTCVA